jgi:hypothetical protein
MGVDRGFKPTTQQNKNQTHKHTKEAAVFAVKTLKELQELPEEYFPDAFSAFSIFALQNDRKEELIELLKGNDQPALELFLKENEIFIHLKAGKDIGYFNSLLIKSMKNLEDQLKQYQKNLSIQITE